MRSSGNARRAAPGPARRLALAGLAALGVTTAGAGEVTIERVEFVGGAGGQWTVHTTLRHGDTGWEHYADAWRVVGADGTPLGVRTLFHPHVDEQPFTRSLSLRIPPERSVVFVEAHDKVHGWSGDRLRVALDEASGPRFAVERRGE